MTKLLYKQKTPQQRYAEWKARRVQTKHMTNYGKIQTAKLFAELSAILSISPDAARCRYYRRQIKPAVLAKAKKAIGVPLVYKSAPAGNVGAALGQ